MFQAVYGISRGKVDVILQKLKSSGTKFPVSDCRGCHEPINKMTEERNLMRSHIDKYPKYESHYTRRDSNGIYLPSHLNMKKMYDEYKNENVGKGGSYELFKLVFKETGYKFKKPKIDTCKICDTFQINIKQCKNEIERVALQRNYDDHKAMADFAYLQKKEDKESILKNNEKTVLVFNLQKVLNSPSISTNVACYKRLLATYNLTIRDCSVIGGTECYMWHEAIGGRGSNQIASCLYKKLNSLPPHVSHVITDSDTCGGQNRNVNMAIMLSLVTSVRDTLKVIDQKFLLPGHTHLECDADHAKIEKAKKETNISLMVPRDWYQFVRTVRGKKPFKVVVMTQQDFYSFSDFLQSELIKKNTDINGEKINRLQIKWLRFQKEFGIFQFKYSLKDSDDFRTMDWRRNRRGRPFSTQKRSLNLSYNSSLPINQLKKKDLLSLLPLIPEECHQFYEDLATSHRSFGNEVYESEDHSEGEDP
uniref:Putative sola1-8 ap n=1 Tax=Panstrongylus megistus TaxID=65343 RepID=A0A069DZ34_9HEMI